MKKIEQFQITGMTISGFKSYQEPTELSFGNPTTITGPALRTPSPSSLLDNPFSGSGASTSSTTRFSLMCSSPCDLWMRRVQPMN